MESNKHVNTPRSLLAIPPT